MKRLLEISDLKVSVDSKLVVQGVSLSISKGEVHALMGPNGSGKSSLALALTGHPSYKAGGKVKLDGKDLLSMSADKRAREGLMIAFQAPIAIPGVSVFHFLRQAYENLTGEKENVLDFKARLVDLMDKVGLDESFVKRYVNDGFSGGERKKLEVLQVLLFKPRLVILDEVDSGLDVDSLKVVAEVVRGIVDEGESSVLVISHYKRLLEYLKPDKVHIMGKGKIVKSGGRKIVDEIEEKGYGR